MPPLYRAVCLLTAVAVTSAAPGPAPVVLDAVETTPVFVPGTTFHRVEVEKCVTETVWVRRQAVEMRPVLREISRPSAAMKDVVVEVVTQRPVTRSVYREREVPPVPTPVRVKCETETVEMRPTWRRLPRKTEMRDVYVPVVTEVRKVKPVYVREEVPVVRTVCVYRSEGGHVREETKQVVEKATHTKLVMRETTEKVTTYRLESRPTEAADEYALVPWPTKVKHETYREEVRMLPPPKQYDLVPQTTLETVKTYRLERRPAEPCKEYVTEMRPTTVDVYEMVTRTVTRKEPEYRICPADVVREVTVVRQGAVFVPREGCQGVIVTPTPWGPAAMGAAAHGVVIGP